LGGGRVGLIRLWPLLSSIRAYHYQQSLSHCIIFQVVSVQKSHAEKRLILYLEVNIRRFIAMLLLGTKDEQ